MLKRSFVKSITTFFKILLLFRETENLNRLLKNVR